ncbi:hypothetical protein GIB67_009723 [Kingdonia uniflora]|uniref:Uncharacterized protein n=1 Tax=Kingdonia uniflora TaxID=39325 RepID=A0A7J7LB37_9MAGN|nr:hypothetical protein GIB67_009723 [Kingdonia uniflora]
MEENEPIDDLSLYKTTRCIGNDLCNTEDGSAEREVMKNSYICSHCNKFRTVEEERETNIEARDKIFKDVIREDGHGRVLCKGVVARPKNARSRSSSLSFQNCEDELSKLQREADEREARYQQENENIKASVNSTIQIEVKRLMQMQASLFRIIISIVESQS